ncbi:MAG: PT domain-containing protein, partial [Methanophagales archaeon]|nr:PT domain-containing protein [Methanophagales archaeon]
ADDGDGNTDTVDVEIVTAVPTVAPTVAPTAAPTVAPTAVPTVEPTAEPTAEPTPEPPGFEAVFAIAGMLAIAYLVLRKRRE